MEEPAAKRPRLGDGEAAPQQPAATADPQARQLGPNIKSLFQVAAGLPREPSPGAMHGCRIAAWALPGTDLAFASVLASGASVYWSQVVLQQHVRPEQGKEGIFLPVRLKAPAVVQLEGLKHVGEVQALALAQSPQQPHQVLLATVDAFGLGSISRLDISQAYSAAAAGEDAADAAAVQGAAAPAAVVCQARLKPQDSCREGGWAGVAFSSSSSSDNSSAGLMVATARGFAQDVSLYDAGRGSVVRTFYCGLNPYALKFLPAGIGGHDANLLAVAECHMISLWDVRASGAGGGCVQRLPTATVGQPLYALDWCTAQTGLLGSAGAERSVFLTEPRKWRTLSKWGGATRLAVHSLSFLEQDPHYAVLAGLDMEVLCGRWDKAGSNSSRVFQSAVPGEDEPAAAAAAAAAGQPATAAAAVPAATGAPGSGDRSRGEGGGASEVGCGGFSFRGDARWLGVSKAAGVDVLAGFAASGNLVYARVC